MNIKSSQTLVSEALKEIKTITPDEALKLSNNGKLYANKHYNYDEHFKLLEKYMGIVND